MSISVGYVGFRYDIIKLGLSTFDTDRRRWDLLTCCQIKVLFSTDPQANERLIIKILP